MYLVWTFPVHTDVLQSITYTLLLKKKLYKEENIVFILNYHGYWHFYSYSSFLVVKMYV